MGDSLNLILKIINFPLFNLNQTPITLGSILVFFGVIVGFALFGRIVIKKWLTVTFLKLKIEEGTSYNLTRIAYYFLLFIGVLVAFQFVGINLSSLVVVFGFLSVGIGFGLQNLTSNFISGLIILFERPIRVGDRITIGDQEGDVIEINIRSTTIRSRSNISIIVPNSEFISSRVINWSHIDKKVRINIDVGVSYSSDLDKVLEALYLIAKSSNEVMTTPEPDVLFLGFGDSSWNLCLQVWISDPKRHPNVRSDINCDIVRMFKEKNIEIPFPQRDVHFKK